MTTDTQPEIDEDALTEEALGAEAAAEEQAVNQDLQAELLQWRDKALRTAAEYDNYRKRSAKEREESMRYANQRLLEELLPVIDNFDMGMQAASADTSSMIYIGMSMVQRQLQDFLTNLGVTEIPAEIGHIFDHNLHEAIQREESPEAEGAILRIVRKGYRLKDRLLRPSNVVVAHHEETPSQ